MSPKLTHNQAIFRGTSNAAIPLSIYRIGPFAVYFFLVLIAYPFYRFLVAPDAVSYIAIADHYLHGEWAEAFNSYWSPLISWLVAPLLAIGVPGLIAIKLVCILAGFGTLWYFRRVIRLLNLSPLLELIALYTAAVMVTRFALVWITPDLLTATIVLYYLGIILSPDYANRSRAGLLCGIAGVIGYFSKAYNFYYFLIHFTLVSAFYWITNTDTRRTRITRHFVTGLIVFLLGCAPWITVLSIRTGSLTMSTAGDWNHRIVGPNSSGPPQFYRLMPPSGPHALSMWENPSPSLLPAWSPLASIGNLKHQMRITASNLRGLLQLVDSTSLLGLAALLAFLVWGLSQTGATRSLWLLIALSIALMPAGYLLVTLRDRYGWESRYFWAGVLLVMLTGFAIIHAAEPSLTRLAKGIAVTVYALSFAVAPLLQLVQTRNLGRDLYTIGTILKPVIPAGSRLASCGQWNNGFGVAYHSGARFYGSTGITADEEEFRSILNPNRHPAGIPKQMTPEEIARSLRSNHIDYLLVWPDCRVQAAPDALKEQIDIPGQFDLKLYRLRY
jgi:hypothetical protein